MFCVQVQISKACREGDDFLLVALQDQGREQVEKMNRPDDINIEGVSKILREVYWIDFSSGEIEMMVLTSASAF